MSRISTLSELEMGRAEDQARIRARRRLQQGVRQQSDERQRLAQASAEASRRMAESNLNRSRGDVDRDYRRDRAEILRSTPLPLQTAQESMFAGGQDRATRDRVGQERRGRMALADAARRSAMGLSLPESARETIAQWGGTEAQRGLGNYRAGLQALGYKPDEIERMSTDYQRQTFGMGSRPPESLGPPTGQYQPIGTPNVDADVQQRLDAMEKTPQGSVAAAIGLQEREQQTAADALAKIQGQAKGVQAQDVIDEAARQGQPLDPGDIALAKSMAEQLQDQKQRAELLVQLDNISRIPRREAKPVFDRLLSVINVLMQQQKQVADFDLRKQMELTDVHQKEQDRFVKQTQFTERQAQQQEQWEWDYAFRASQEDLKQQRFEKEFGRRQADARTRHEEWSQEQANKIMNDVMTQVNREADRNAKLYMYEGRLALSKQQQAAMQWYRENKVAQGWGQVDQGWKRVEQGQQRIDNQRDYQGRSLDLRRLQIENTQQARERAQTFMEQEALRSGLRIDAKEAQRIREAAEKFALDVQTANDVQRREATRQQLRERAQSFLEAEALRTGVRIGSEEAQRIREAAEKFGLEQEKFDHDKRIDDLEYSLSLSKQVDANQQWDQNYSLRERATAQGDRRLDQADRRLGQADVRATQRESMRFRDQTPEGQFAWLYGEKSDIESQLEDPNLPPDQEARLRDALRTNAAQIRSLRQDLPQAHERFLNGATSSAQPSGLDALLQQQGISLDDIGVPSVGVGLGEPGLSIWDTLHYAPTEFSDWWNRYWSLGR